MRGRALCSYDRMLRGYDRMLRSYNRMLRSYGRMLYNSSFASCVKSFVISNARSISDSDR